MIDAPLGPDPASAKASLTLKDGRVLEGRDVRREGDLYILTHPEQREILRRRAQKLDSMFEDGRW